MLPVLPYVVKCCQLVTPQTRSACQLVVKVQVETHQAEGVMRHGGPEDGQSTVIIPQAACGLTTRSVNIDQEEQPDVSLEIRSIEFLPVLSRTCLLEVCHVQHKLNDLPCKKQGQWCTMWILE